jgi:drug/metabolite transporter (DMT)-like permease
LKNPAGILMASLAPAIQAALLMVLADACGSVMNVVIRHLSAELHPFEIAFFRNFFGFLAVLPFLGGLGLGILRTHHLLRLLATGAGQAISMLTMFVAIAAMPLAQLTALTFTKPLFVTIGAALILHEVVRARRWSAVGIGFVGILIVVRPGSEAMQPAAILALISSVVFAGVALAIKDLVRSERIHTVVLYQAGFTAILSLPPALLFWHWPSLGAWPLLALTGVLGTIGWLAFTRAFQLADASALMPYEFLKLPMMAVLAYLFFAEVPHIWTWIGGTVIFASTVYITHREAQLARERLAADASRDVIVDPSPPSGGGAS